MECETLDDFLRVKEKWEPFAGDAPAIEVKPIGVPGAYSPLQMNPKHRPTPSPGPSPMKPVSDGSRGRQIDAGEELSGFGLEGVTVSEQDLMDLMSELIGEEDAGDLLGVDKKFKKLAVDDKAEGSGSDSKSVPEETPKAEETGNDDETKKNMAEPSKVADTQKDEKEQNLNSEVSEKPDETKKVQEIEKKEEVAEFEKQQKAEELETTQKVEEPEKTPKVEEPPKEETKTAGDPPQKQEAENTQTST